MIKMQEIVCDLCGSGNSRFLLQGKDRLHGREGVFKYVKCKSCGLVYMNPQISRNDIMQFYPDNYSPHSSKVKPLREQRNSLIVKLKTLPVVTMFRNIRKQLFNNVKVISSIRRRLNKQSKLLDVGCGSGKFLSEIKSSTCCQVYGVDISGMAAKMAKENFAIDVFNGPIMEAPFSDNSFDVVTAWWYLEHVSNPSEVLLKMHSLLKNDGYCIIGIPNIDSFNAKLFKDKWYHLDCPRHLHIYSPDTITKLLNKTGFTVTRIFFDKTPWGLWGSLRYFFGDDNVPLRHRRRVRGLSLLKKLLLPWTIFLALLGQSDIIVVCARKEQLT